MIKIENINKSFGDHDVLKNIHFHLNEEKPI